MPMAESLPRAAPEWRDLTWVSTAAPGAVRRTLKGVRDGLAGAGVTARDRANVEIVLAEALNNIAEHAYAGAAAGRVRLCLKVYGDRIVARISDAGRPLGGDGAPAGLAPGLDGPRMALPEGGFGWFLIRALASDVAYARRGGRNHLRLTIPLGDTAKVARQ